MLPRLGELPVSASRAAAYAGALCILALLLEGICAGGSIRARLAELRRPSFAPPLWGWILIALYYYFALFIVLLRLFSQEAGDLRLQTIAIALAIGVLLINAASNYFFFRSRNLFNAFALTLFYSAVSVALFALLVRVDSTAAKWLAPYVAYLIYANVLGYQFWKLNKETKITQARDVCRE